MSLWICQRVNYYQMQEAEYYWFEKASAKGIGEGRGVKGDLSQQQQQQKQRQQQ